MHKKRESGIELLKIFAIFTIVIAHVVQALENINTQIGNYPAEAFIDLSRSTMDLEIFILQNIRYLGMLGNAIFFICSAWFLCDDKKVSLKKIILMCLDIWIISVAYLLIMKCIGVKISTTLIIKSLFPTTFANNWYITFYILIYAIHPLLNLVIEHLSKHELLRFCKISAFLYFGMCFINKDLFFTSKLITYIVLYFCVAYIKKYTPQYTSNIKLNIRVLIIAILINVGLILFTDIFGLIGAQYSEKLGTQVLRWDTNCNPILILIALSLFNIFKELHFENKIVNYISSLSLLVYAIYNNILFRTYVRSLIYVYIYQMWGYDHLLFWVLLYALILFGVSIIFASLYKQTIQRIALKIADQMSSKLIKIL